MNTRQFLAPEKVSATYHRGAGLTIEASGHEDGVQNVRICSAGAIPLEFPLFMLEADETSVTGVLSYSVRTMFNARKNPDAIVIVLSPSENKRYPVRIK
jgi:hypothetical protein